MWCKGTEKNLKLIEAFFPWEVSPDQNTLRTLPKRLEEISGFSQFTSSTHINFQVRMMDGCLQDFLSSRGTPNAEVIQ